ncbi:MAG: hypothetical protein IJ877_02945 [Candidatus Gastranaerophilales bacterium]|nr:hypothetical protein [Candidatus Gastranaerophilales bacterium]
MNNNIETFVTADGSVGLYNKELNEIYHSKFGAKTESLEKFINPAKIIDNHPLDILDLCYGIGYNTKCALDNFKNINSVDCVEIDRELVEKSLGFHSDNRIKNSKFIHFYIQDAREFVKNCTKKYDIIFHDGFAPHKQSILWSEDFILKLSKLLKPKGIYCTYNHSKPVLNALFKAGLILGYGNNSTVASFSKDLIQNPLSEFELGQLNTKSAITYKDKNLNLTHEEIMRQRLEETKSSNLKTLSGYLKTHKT